MDSCLASLNKRYACGPRFGTTVSEGGSGVGLGSCTTKLSVITRLNIVDPYRTFAAKGRQETPFFRPVIQMQNDTMPSIDSGLNMRALVEKHCNASCRDRNTRNWKSGSESYDNVRLAGWVTKEIQVEHGLISTHRVYLVQKHGKYSRCHGRAL
jgi:hypothetical protein